MRKEKRGRFAVCLVSGNAMSLRNGPTPKQYTGEAAPLFSTRVHIKVRARAHTPRRDSRTQPQLKPAMSLAPGGKPLPRGGQRTITRTSAQRARRRNA